MDTFLKDFLYPILFALITGALMVIVKNGLGLIKIKVDEIQKNIKSTTINNYIDEVQLAVDKAVKYVSQTYVDSLKESGHFDEVAHNEAKDKAINKATELISDDAKSAIDEVFNDSKVFLDTLIESKVKELHK